MATLTANPNPVGVQGPTGTGTTRITWNTQSTNPGRVFLTIDGGVRQQFAGGMGGARMGNQNRVVELGHTYVFTLRQVSNDALLATLTVTVVDLVQQSIDRALALLDLRDRFDPPQRIHSLMVRPGVDTVAFNFHTNRPTVPLVQIFDENGTQLALSFPLLGGLQTYFRGTLGQQDPLPQGATLRLRITAWGRPSFLGPAKESVLEAWFETGTRLVDVLFDTITVHNDGDPGIKASGELNFQFAAGDASSSVDVLAPDFEGNISSGDPARRVDRSVILPAGPRNVYVRVWGDESDFGIPAPGQGFGGFGRLGFRGIGSDESEDAFGPDVWVARIVDVSENPPGFTSIPLEMRTAPLGIDYTVNGRVETIVRPGKGVFTFDLPPGSFTEKKVLGHAGTSGFAGGADGKGMLVGRGGDGSLWWKRVDPAVPVPRAQGWERAAADPGGAVTVVAMGDGRAEVLALDAEGAALRLAGGVDDGREATWEELGGRFSGALEAAANGRGGVDVVGLDAQGRVHHRALAGTGDWREIGADVQCELHALAVPDGGLAVLAIDREGRVVHAGGRGELVALRPIGGPRAVLLGARAVEGGGIEIAALDEDDILHILHWPDWPEGDPARGWKSLGGLDEIYAPRPLAMPGPRVGHRGEEDRAPCLN